MMMTEYTSSLYGACVDLICFAYQRAARFSALLLLATIFIFVLTGCITSPEQKDKWVFTCPDGYEFTAVFSQDNEFVTLEDETLKLKLDIERSASGVKYTNGTTVFWNKGVMARVDYGDGVLHQECQGDSY
jgi:membrane-bound inhibitor of C-type lysozyme